MISVEPKDLTLQQVGAYLLGGVAPRPIAFVSTMAPDGTKNLSPYSFFNAFGQNPPMVAFSPSRRVRDNSVKDTYTNLLETGECVINAVTHSIVEQMNLASCEFGPDVDEFERAGFTPVDSDLVKPKRVKESPFQMECRLFKMLELGGKAGSGNLAVCEVVKFHVAEDIVENGVIVPDRIDLVGRNGASYYTRAKGHAVFTVPKPGKTLGIGYPGLPDYIRNSDVYTANNLGRFGLVDQKPSEKEVMDFIESIEFSDSTEQEFRRYMAASDYRNMLVSALALEKAGKRKAPLYLEQTAKTAIEKDDRDFAWKTAIYKGMKFG